MDLQRARSTCVFVLAGAVNSVFATLHYAPPFLAAHGAAALTRELVLQLATSCLVGLGIMLALRRQLSRPAQALRRPGRFILTLAGAAVPLGWLAITIQAGVHAGRLLFELPPLPDFLVVWLAILLWGGLFAWLYLLYLQRRADQLRLNAVLAERAMLSHRLAQAELLAARARIDPVMVADVLRQVQLRYAQDPQPGAALLDQLVGYLRLALNRAKRHDDGAAAALQALRMEAGR